MPYSGRECPGRPGHERDARQMGYDDAKSEARAEIGDLQRQLQQAQEELDAAERETRWASQFECPVHGTCDWSMVSTAKTCMATLSNGQPCEKTLQRGPNPWDAAIERAEAAERERDARWTEAEAKDEVAEVLEVAAIHVVEQRALLDRLFEYVMVQEGGFKDVLLANEVADYLGPAEAQARQEEGSDARY